MFCPYCGKKISDGKFCPFCGKRIDTEGIDDIDKVNHKNPINIGDDILADQNKSESNQNKDENSSGSFGGTEKNNLFDKESQQKIKDGIKVTKKKIKEEFHDKYQKVEDKINEEKKKTIKPMSKIWSMVLWGTSILMGLGAIGFFRMGGMRCYIACMIMILIAYGINPIVLNKQTKVEKKISIVGIIIALVVVGCLYPGDVETYEDDGSNEQLQEGYIMQQTYCGDWSIRINSVWCESDLLEDNVVKMFISVKNISGETQLFNPQIQLDNNGIIEDSLYSDYYGKTIATDTSFNDTLEFYCPSQSNTAVSNMTLTINDVPFYLFPQPQEGDLYDSLSGTYVMKQEDYDRSFMVYVISNNGDGTYAVSYYSSIQSASTKVYTISLDSENKFQDSYGEYNLIWNKEQHQIYNAFAQQTYIKIN